MKSLRTHYITITLFIILSVTYVAPAAHSQILCDEFSLLTTVEGDKLFLSVVTDLPDNTVVMVGVSRSYLEKGNSAKYSLDYFSEKSTVGKWRSKHTISIASKEWKSALRAKQEKMSRIGLDFDVTSISDNITVSMIVPINQPDPRFGERNSNLTGKAVTMASRGGKTVAGKVVGPMYVVENKTEISYPLDRPPVGRFPSPRLNPLDLETGQAYIVSKQTPLMPSVNPPDPMAAIQQMKQIPKGGIFKVLETSKHVNTPWYKVMAYDEKKKQIGMGWINSTALLGQKLKAEAENPSKDLALTAQPAEAPSYKIINEDILPGIKRSLDVRLNKKVSEETLREIALKLKTQDSRNYERTFICYYLPDMEPGKGAWATTHFDPNLEIRILGLTVEEENFLRQLPDDPSREVIGSWLNESPFIGSRITIFRQSGKLLMENSYKDGSCGKEEIVEKASGKDRTFQRKEGSSVGEFYLIDNQGNLQIWDEEGYILTAKKTSTVLLGQKLKEPIIDEAAKEFYLRIGFFNDTDKKPISPNCKMWIRGSGDFYPARQEDWEFGGTLIEEAGPFDVNKEHTIYFYPDYLNESKVIAISFKYSAGMSLKGSVRDMLTISIKPEMIIFEGISIKNANDEFECKFNRKTCKKVY